MRCKDRRQKADDQHRMGNSNHMWQGGVNKIISLLRRHTFLGNSGLISVLSPLGEHRCLPPGCIASRDCAINVEEVGPAEVGVIAFAAEAFDDTPL